MAGSVDVDGGVGDGNMGAPAVVVVVLEADMLV
jgi:hypothetical protein